MFELFPARLSGSDNFNIPHNSKGFSDKKMVFNPDASIALFYSSFL